MKLYKHHFMKQLSQHSEKKQQVPLGNTKIHIGNFTCRIFISVWLALFPFAYGKAQTSAGAPTRATSANNMEYHAEDVIQSSPQAAQSSDTVIIDKETIWGASLKYSRKQSNDTLYAPIKEKAVLFISSIMTVKTDSLNNSGDICGTIMHAQWGGRAWIECNGNLKEIAYRPKENGYTYFFPRPAKTKKKIWKALLQQIDAITNDLHAGGTFTVSFDGRSDIKNIFLIQTQDDLPIVIMPCRRFRDDEYNRNVDK